MEIEDRGKKMTRSSILLNHRLPRRITIPAEYRKLFPV